MATLRNDVLLLGAAGSSGRLIAAGAKPGAWTPGQLFGADFVTDDIGAQVTVNGQRAK